MEIPKSYIKNVANNLNFENRFLKKINDSLYLSTEEIELLELAKIPYDSCASLEELIMLIEEIIESEMSDSEDLEYLSQTLAERNYYQNTNK